VSGTESSDAAISSPDVDGANVVTVVGTHNTDLDVIVEDTGNPKGFVRVDFHGENSGSGPCTYLWTISPPEAERTGEA
jgi:hypothetical protein